MSLIALIVGLFLQLIFAVFQLMAVIFIGGVAANGTALYPWQMSVLNASIFLLPSLSIVVSCLLIFLYKTESPYLSYWWHIIPLLALCLYIIFVFAVSEA